MLVIVSVVISAILVVVIALVAVGSVVAHQRDQLAPVVYDLEEAVAFVADRLPSELTARVSFEDVRQVLKWRIESLQQREIASYGIDQANPAQVDIIEPDDVLAEVIAQADRAEAELNDQDLALILDAEADYLRQIGAVGDHVATA